MPHSSQLRSDALAIWQAGVDAVRSDRLVDEHVRIAGDQLVIGDEQIPLGAMRRIVVVGAGKAGAGMAAGLEAALGPQVLAEKQATGWINVPADCVRPLSHIHLHAAREAGVNEPTEAGVAGSERILQLVSELGADDLCICLISGGGSALLPAPVAGVSLADKQELTRHLSAAGANIRELNTVRKQLSRIKGGGLARTCRAGRLVALVISDVLGDPLDVIASAPTVPDSATPQDALAILQRFHVPESGIAPAAIELLSQRAVGNALLGVPRPAEDVNSAQRACRVTNLVIGNNALAVEAAGHEAVRRGYSPEVRSATTLEGSAEEIGIDLARQARRMSSQAGPNCLITGGEPTVRLAPPEIRGTGGRNQQLVLAALLEAIAPNPRIPTSEIRRPYALLSGGTDGEDGPTDAAGAVLDAEIIARMRAQGPDPADFLRRNDAYSFFAAVGGLIKTGPTHTNVCDLRVLVVARTGERGASAP